MDKLKMHSPNLTEANIDKLAELFPSCITEARDDAGELRKAIDFDLLRQELSFSIVDGAQERYQLNWPGKREALLTANAPIAKTLRPCRDESVGFDTTQNLFIEGDNLEALKLLQEAYLNKVKMIYIDPPYNTGTDLIYEDDFSEESGEYFKRSNQIDEHGNRLVVNVDTNGRFHSDWLSMIYSRIKLARNLLRDDGVIFLSIDYRECANLRRMCDEVFGEQNFIAEIAWEKMYTTKNDSSLVSCCHESILVYAKVATPACIGFLPRSAEMDARYSNPDNDPRGNWKAIPMYADGERKNGRFKITSPTGKEHEPESNTHWRYSEADIQKLISDNRVWFGQTGNSKPNLKRFLSELREGVKAKTLWSHKEVGSNDTASRELKELFDGRSPFSFPKPTSLIRRMLQLGAESRDSIVLDFFSGSASTAHAVMAMNADDGGQRRYILVQLNEPTDEKSDAFLAGYQSISEISKERIRRAGTKIKAASAMTAPDLDIGFRALKIDTSNMKEVYYTPDAVSQDLLSDQVDNIREDRTAEDLLFQVLLDWGVDLALPINQQVIVGKTVFFVDGNALVACFDTGIDEDFVKQLAGYKPLRVVFRDAGFASDSVKINVEQMFKLLSPATEIKTI
ncbi:site-specific DNA-methyltransferase [Pseudomonas cichorii]|nr:site-specific DNA-methyltransferase [Pseudomonas cichorii]